MKFELKRFQEVAARDILSELDEARLSVVKAKPQVVILSAPTGSGKTITIAEVIDLTYAGGDGISPRPDTTFLWLSDSPELNVQSKNKLLSACDHLPFHRMITIDSEEFDAERLEKGHVYFINTQLLGKDKLLTKGTGDKRDFTFWQTIANTIAAAPQDFILIIDEAHRGATASDRNRMPIMQKFILGSPADGLPPVPLVLGMSATPQRFTALLGSTNRTQRPINIDPDEIRESGLLKDWIVVRNPKSNVSGDLTLLEDAARSWKNYTALWSEYCKKEKEKDTVRPILVVQVEDGSGSSVTKSPLAEIVRVIERHTGPLGVNEIVHCFQEQTDLSVAGRIIRKLDASRIQNAPDVKVVLFKTALTTGWDCPRAEVMMSFRRAQDATTIAQLVGRMIRTPLARRIKTIETLDTVELFLPHYDKAALEEVLKRLRNPEAEEGVPTRVESAVGSYPRNPRLPDVFKRLERLHTYSVMRVPKMGDVKRALRLGGLLLHESVCDRAESQIRGSLLSKLEELRKNYSETIKDWSNLIKEGGEIEVDVTRVATGRMTVDGSKTTRIALSEENIEQMFDAAGRVLASGEGLHRTYWKMTHDKERPNRAKLELFAMLQQPATMESLEKHARDLFAQYWSIHKTQVQGLGEAAKSRFLKLVMASGSAEAYPWDLPEEIVEKKEGKKWPAHLYCDADGQFQASLNGWEEEVITQEQKSKEFVGWLRNMARHDWALCIPYEMGGLKSFFPDFIVARRKGKEIVIDVVEPHDDSRVDTWAKARGLATFADSHGLEFGRLVIARKKGSRWQFADVNDKATRERARRMQSSVDLESLFEG